MPSINSRESLTRLRCQSQQPRIQRALLPISNRLLIRIAVLLNVTAFSLVTVQTPYFPPTAAQSYMTASSRACLLNTQRTAFLAFTRPLHPSNYVLAAWSGTKRVPQRGNACGVWPRSDRCSPYIAAAILSLERCRTAIAVPPHTTKTHREQTSLSDCSVCGEA